MTFLIPVFAILAGVIWLDESITARMVICGLVILAGTTLSTGLLKLGWLERPQQPRGQA